VSKGIQQVYLVNCNLCKKDVGFAQRELACRQQGIAARWRQPPVPLPPKGGSFPEDFVKMVVYGATLVEVS